MNASDSQEITEQERERVLLRAEYSSAFRLAAQALSDIVDLHGEPEMEIEVAIGQNRDLLVMFRLMRIAAQVNARLAGSVAQARFTEEEWRHLRLQNGILRKKQEFMEQKQANRDRRPASSLDKPSRPASISPWPSPVEIALGKKNLLP